MKRISAPFRLSLSGALVAAMVAAAAAAAAQNGTLTSTTPTATALKKKPTTATPDMVNEAIQRSEARAAKAKQTGTPETFGSEEPFTYNPAQKNFTAAQQ
jgi:hypothetical protein